MIHFLVKNTFRLKYVPHNICQNYKNWFSYWKYFLCPYKALFLTLTDLQTYLRTDLGTQWIIETASMFIEPFFLSFIYTFFKLNMGIRHNQERKKSHKLLDNGIYMRIRFVEKRILIRPKIKNLTLVFKTFFLWFPKKLFSTI